MNIVAEIMMMNFIVFNAPKMFLHQKIVDAKISHPPDGGNSRAPRMLGPKKSALLWSTEPKGARRVR